MENQQDAIIREIQSLCARFNIMMDINTIESEGIVILKSIQISQSVGSFSRILTKPEKEEAVDNGWNVFNTIIQILRNYFLVLFALIVAIILILSLLLVPEVKAEDYHMLEQKVQALERARELDADQQTDPSYWMMRELIINNRADEDDSTTSRILERQILADQYPEYFDHNYNYDRSKKYIDRYDY